MIKGAAYIKARILLFFLIGLLFSLGACLGSETGGPASPSAGVINLSMSSSVSFSPAIASEGERIYIVWAENINGNLEILLRRSEDGGLSFSTPLNVSNTASSSSNAKVAISGTSLYIVWEEFLSKTINGEDKSESDIFFRKAEDNGDSLSWSDPKNLSLSPPVCGPNQLGIDPCPSQSPAIAAEGNMVVIAWSEATNYVLKDITTGNTGKDFSLINGDISLRASSNRGMDFDLFSTSPIIVSTLNSSLNPTPSASPALAALGGLFFISWTDFLSPNLDQEDSKIFFRHFDSTTSTFTPSIGSLETILSNPVSGPAGPALAAEGSSTYLIFEGTPATGSGCTPGSDIFFSKSTDGFSSLSHPPVNISNSSCRASGGKISVTEDTIYVVWEDNSPELSGILFRRSSDGGLNFSEATKLSPVGSSVAAPATSATSTGLLSVWEDALPGNLEVFFRKQ